MLPSFACFVVISTAGAALEVAPVEAGADGFCAGVDGAELAVELLLLLPPQPAINPATSSGETTPIVTLFTGPPQLSSRTSQLQRRTGTGIPSPIRVGGRTFQRGPPGSDSSALFRCRSADTGPRQATSVTPSAGDGCHAPADLARRLTQSR